MIKKMIGIAIFGWFIIAIGIAIFVLPVVNGLSRLKRVAGSDFAIFGLFIFPLFISAFLIFSGRRILNLRKGAWKEAVFFNLLGLLIFILPSFISLSVGLQISFDSGVIAGVLFCLGWIYYFTRPKVKEQFK